MHYSPDIHTLMPNTMIPPVALAKMHKYKEKRAWLLLKPELPTGWCVFASHGGRIAISSATFPEEDFLDIERARGCWNSWIVGGYQLMAWTTPAHEGKSP